MSTQINEISKVFLHGETLESSELNAIISQVNSAIRKINTVETNLDNHEYDVGIPITNIYCRTKKGISANGFFPEADAKRDELLELVSNCSITQGIRYNTTFSVVTLSDNADLMNGIWTAYPLGVTEFMPHEWEVSYKKLDDNTIIYMYGPVLRSNYGFSGSDGDSIQYIYKLFDHELTETERTNNTPTKPENPNSNGEFIPSGWFDDPQNTTSEYPFLYVSALKRINGTWGSFEKISLWSTYSEDGTNGDFLARAFCRFIPIANKLAPNTPIGGTYENPQPGSNDSIQWSLTVPSGSEPLWTSTRVFKGTGLATEWSTPAIEADSAELDIEYSSSSERPANNTLRDIPGTPHPSNNIWHDPSEANLDLSAMVWRAERKIKNGQYNGEWVITKIAGLKGSFKSIVFRRFKPTMLQSTPPIPTGGTYNNPIPDGGLWFDGIPAGDSRTEGPVWASTRIFTDDGVQNNWSSPQLLTDSEDLDIEFSPGIGEEHTQPSNPTGEPFSNREASGWYDSSSINFNSVGPMIWRAERKVDNGQYVGNWTITRIYGEKGELGYRGDFVSRVFCRSSSLPATPTGGEYDSPIPTNTDLHGVLIWSDGIPATGPGTIWTSYRKFYGDPSHAEDSWSTPVIEADSESLDIEYSISTTEPSIQSLRSTPNGTHPSNPNGQWYDPSNISNIPLDPNTNEKYPIIWRAERKISGTQYVGDWVITRILGETGPEGRRGSFKSCVFKRSNSVLSNFNTTDDGATYDSPIPTGWSDGIPSGDEALWMAVSKFTGEGDTHSSWTVTLQTDSSDLDIEFSPGTGTGHDCPPMNLSVFTHPINNYEPNGNPPKITQDREDRNTAGWWDSSQLDENSPTMVWRAERKINGLQLYEGNWVITRILGEKGDPATLTEAQLQDLDSAGLQIVVTPLNIILDLLDALTGSTDDKIDDITASIVVYNRTGTALANNQYLIKATDGVTLYATNGQIVNGVLQPLTPLTDYVEVSGANLTDAKSVKIKNLPITTTTENGNSTYTYTYNKGYIRVILTVPVGTSTKDVRIDIPWYLNKLGERETKIRGDVASTYMSRTAFSNPNDPVISAYTASILDGADGKMAEYGLILSKTGGGYELAFDANYILTAKENISKLNKSVTGTNLIADNGWCKSFTTISSKKRTACSPFVYLKPGKYIFSTYINSNTSVDDTIKLGVKLSNTKLNPSTLLTDFANEGWTTVNYNGVLTANVNTGYEGDYYPSANVSPNYVRIYFVFTVNESSSNETYKEGYYSFHVLLNNTNFTTCIRPQLELCLDSNTDLMPTVWIPGPQDFSSEIKLTADGITLAIAGPNKTLSQFKLTFDGISQTVSDHTGRFSTIESRLDSINLLTGVSESTLNTAGLYLRAGLNEEPSMVKVMAGQFSVVLPPEEEGDPEEIIFGNDPSTNTMVFSGDLKTGEEDGDYYNSYYHYLGIFPNFSTGEYYERGKCVKYNNKVYRFNKNHPSGAWKTGEQIDYEEINSDYLDDLIVNTNGIYTDGSGRLGGGHIYWNSDGSIYLGTGSVTPKGNNYKKEDFERNWYVEDGESTWNSKRDTVFDKLYGGRYASDGLRIINNFTDSEGNVNTTISLQADNTLDLSLGRINLTNAASLGGGVSVSPFTNDQHQTSVSMSTQTGFVISRKNYNNSNDSHNDQWKEHYGSSGALTISYSATPSGAASTIVNTYDEESNNGKDLGLKIRIKALDGNAYKGFTGEYDSMYFINGICVGPTSGFNNVNPFTNPDS